MTSSQQLAFDLPSEPRYGREDFLESTCNEAALRLINLWPRWPDPMLLLVGPEGAGKSHLGAIWARDAGAAILRSEADWASAPANTPVLVEDADRFLGDEADLFHRVNRLRQDAVPSLVTARRRPDHWGLATPDIVSRLRLAPVVEIDEPEETLVRSVLVKLLSDRQLIADADVVDYLGRRIDRSLGMARAVVAALDRESLTLRRPINRLMASTVLKRLREDAG